MLSKQRESHFQNHLQMLQKKVELQKQKRKKVTKDFEEELHSQNQQKMFLQSQINEMKQILQNQGNELVCFKQMYMIER